jgi:hypothetical protein
MDDRNIDYILNKLEAVDPRYLDNLLVFDKSKRTPLHVAVKNANNKAVSVIVTKLIVTEINNVDSFKDIINDLIDYEVFLEYMNYSFFSNEQMRNVHTINLNVGN